MPGRARRCANTPRDTNKVRTALLAFYLCYESIQWVLNPIYDNHYILNILKLAFSLAAKYCDDINPFPFHLFGNDCVFSHKSHCLPVLPNILIYILSYCVCWVVLVNNMTGLPTPPPSSDGNS